MKQKAFFITFKGLSLKQKKIFFGREGPTLREINMAHGQVLMIFISNKRFVKMLI